MDDPRDTQAERPFFVRDTEAYPDSNLGTDVMLLLAFPQLWAVRRIEKIEFLDDRSVRRQVSVDLELPLEAPIVGRSPGDAYLIPLALLTKAPLVGFDLRDEAGNALPILSKRENSLVAWSAVSAIAESVLGDDVPGDVLRMIRDIVSAHRERARELLAELQESKSDKIRNLMSDEDFRQLLEDLADNFLLLTPVAHEAGRRRILKFSYIEPVELETFTIRQRLGVDAAPFRFALPAIDEAESFHFEIEAPRGMDVFEAEIVEVDDRGQEGSQLVYEGTRGQRTHLYPPRATYGTSAEARVWLLPVTRGLVRSALFFALGVLGMLIALYFRLPSEAENSAPTLLLALPGVVSIFLVRPGENPMTSRLLLGLRAVVSLIGFLPFAGALLLVLDLDICVERRIWLGMTILGLLAGLVVGEAYSASKRQ